MKKCSSEMHQFELVDPVEWPVFPDNGLNCESQGEKGRTCKNYKILIGS
jgi:hypothetical protein